VIRVGMWMYAMRYVSVSVSVGVVLVAVSE
jgi:hypothetical protein